jgi:hypothetical protein
MLARLTATTELTGLRTECSSALVRGMAGGGRGVGVAGAMVAVGATVVAVGATGAAATTVAEGSWADAAMLAADTTVAGDFMAEPVAASMEVAVGTGAAADTGNRYRVE